MALLPWPDESVPADPPMDAGSAPVSGLVPGGTFDARTDRLSTGTRPISAMSETATAQNRVQHRASTDGIDVMAGESVLANVRPGWSVWWKPLALAVVIAFFGLGGGSPAVGFVGGGLVLGYVVFSRMQSRYVVTDERVQSRVGFLSSQQREYRIADIQSISTSQSVFERPLGHGSITLRTAANDQITWQGVPGYRDVTAMLREQQRNHE